MTLHLIVLICFLTVEPIMFFILRNEAKPKKNLILGVTLPAAVWEHEAVTGILRTYKKRLLISTLAMCALIFTVLPVKSQSFALTLYLCWMLIAVILPFFIYASANRALIRCKEENGWTPAHTIDIAVDTKAMQAVGKGISPVWFILPFAISLFPIIEHALRRPISGANAVMFWMYIGNTVMVLLFWMSYRYLYRDQLELVNDDTSLTVALTRVRKRKWALCWGIVCWMTAVLNVILYFVSSSGIAALILYLAYAVLMIVLVMYTEFALRAVQEKLTAAAGDAFYVDDDRHWPLGLFYYNPDDNKLIKNNRTGMNTTVNLARPAGKVLTVLCAVLLATMPLWGVLMMVEEHTPITLLDTGTAITAKHLSTDYVLPYAQIKNVSLLSELPACAKTAGTNFDCLFKGVFTVEGYGSCRLCLNPQSHAFLVVKTDNDTYILSAATDDMTREVYLQYAAKGAKVS